MKRIIILLLITVMTTALFAGERTIEKNIAAGENENITVSITSGRLVIKNWDRPELEVKGTIEKNVKDIIVERVGGRLIVRDEIEPKAKSRGREIRCDLEIFLPAGGKLTASLVNGNITTAYRGRDLNLKLVNGNIEVESKVESLELQNVNGDMKIEGSSERLEAVLISGDCRIEGDHPRSRIKSTNGDIWYKGEAIEDLSIYTNNGNAQIKGTSFAEAEIELGTVNGNLSLNLPQSEPMEIKVRSLNGKISYDKNSFDRVEGDSKRLRLERGEGGARISIEMLNGRLELID